MRNSVVWPLMFAICGFIAFSVSKATAQQPSWMQCSALGMDGSIGDTDLRLFEDGRILRPKTDFRNKVGMGSDIRSFWHDFADTMQRREVQFSFLPIPPNGLRLGFDEFAPRGFTKKSSLASWKRLLRQWELLKVDVIDLLPAMRPLGLKTVFMRDHHWSPIGAKAAAGYVAETLLAEEWLQDYPQEEYSLVGSEFEQLGSFAGKYTKICGKEPPLETATQWDAQWESDDLFGDSPEPVVTIVGASNLMPQYGFTAHLTNGIKRPVYNAHVVGGGFQHGILSVLYDENGYIPQRLLWVSPGYQGQIFKPEDMHREILAAAQGRCDLDNAISVHETTATKDGFSVDLQRPADGTGALYLQFSIPRDDQDRLAFSDELSLELDIHSDHGDHWQYKFARNVPGLDTFSLPLPTRLQWGKIKIDFHAKMQQNATIYLCTSPYKEFWPEALAFIAEK